MSQEVIDIVIHNLVFWAAYAWLATLPYRMLQKQIDNS